MSRLRRASLHAGTKADAHLYRARAAIFEPLLERSREPTAASVVPVTDPQYLRYILDTDLLDASTLSDITRTANVLKLETPSEIRGPENRAETERLIRHADRYRRILLDLGALRPSGRFDEINPHLLEAFKGFLKMIEELAATLMAWSPDEASAHSSAIQAALDWASDELESAHEKMEEAFPEGLEQDPPEERIANLAGGTRLPGGGELQTLGDLSSRGFDSFEQFISRGPEGYRYFSDLLTVPLVDLPDEMPPALYMLSLLLNELEDPVGIRRPASFFLDVLRDAYSAEPKLMLGAAVKVQKSLGEAGATLATLAPQVDALLKEDPRPPRGRPENLPGRRLRRPHRGLLQARHQPAALRYVRVQGLPEDLGGHLGLVHLRDEASVVERRGRRAGLGSRPRWCRGHRAQLGRAPRVRAPRERRTFRTKEPPRPHHRAGKGDEQRGVGGLVRRLVRTILSLSIAAQLFQCDHIREISSDLYGVEIPRVLRPTYLQLLLGIVGLLEPEITAEGKKVRVRAVAAPYRPPSTVEEY